MWFFNFDKSKNRMALTSMSKIFFRNMLFTVFIFIVAYSIFFLTLGAKLSVIILMSVGVLGLPAAYFLDKFNFQSASRLLFISVSLVCVYSSHLGFREDMFAEYYFIPAIMLALLLFEPEQKKEIALGWALPVFAWILTRWGPTTSLSDEWYAKNVNSEFLRNLNFFGAFLLSSVFVLQYRSFLQALKQITAYELENTKTIHQQLENAQRMAKIGNWSFEIKSKRLFWSKELFRIYELPHLNSDELFKVYRQMFYKDDIKILDSVIGQTLKTGLGYEVEYRIQLKNGEIKTLLGRGELEKNKNGEPYKLFGTAQDITEAKKFTEDYQLQQKKIMASAKMASLGEMAGGVAHEINNPLAVIQGKSYQIITKLEKQSFDPQKVKTDLEKIIAHTERIAKIVSGLRSFSRNANQDPMAEFKVHQTINEVLDFCSARFKNHGVELEINVPENLIFECRSVQISQVLLNLIYNSFDAVQTLEHKWIRVEAKDLNEFIEIRITDSGHGIPSQVAERMMDPFFTTKELGKGTGLGLSVSLGIIEDHNGKLTYDSFSPNTCFNILLPKKQNAAQLNAS